ncbi:MAG: AEC family transporter, partial [Lachnospiraceae bacterium]|nr:AEC family transporter [Lachnospiraceae bacterium]
MTAVLIKAVTFVGIIFLGYFLKRIGFFQEKDFFLLSKIVIKITLPAAIAYSFASMELSPSMLVLTLFGFGGGVLMILLGYLVNRKKSREERAFSMLNVSGYNIGNFALPFVQNFLGPAGVMTTSLFDSGNAVICLGGAYSVASMVGGTSKGGSPVKNIAKALGKSVPFLVYVIMIIVRLLDITLPPVLISFAGTISNANAFMAMLMLGVGFKLTLNKEYTGKLVKYLLLRYSAAAVLASAYYFLLPFSLEIRQALVLVAFAPVASANPPFTAEMKGDIGLSSAFNSLSIVVSIV